MTHKQLIAGVIVASALVPALSFAQSTDLQSQIQALMSQIQALQQQIHALVASSSGQQGWMNGSSTEPWMSGSSTPPWNNGTTTAPNMHGQPGKPMCITLNRDLGVGSQGDDVRDLQNILGQDPSDGFTASSTGFFGPLTANAMMKFQMQMNIASSTNGSVGPLTRGFFQRECGQGEGMGQSSTGSPPHMGPMMPAGQGSSTPPQYGSGNGPGMQY